LKLNIKAIAAAVAVLASSSSFANIVLNNDATASPEVLFAAFDAGAGVGFVLDTNIAWSTLTTGYTPFSYDLDNSAAWGSFTAAVAAAGAASTGIQWGVYSGKSGSTVALDSGVLLGNGSNTTSPAITAAGLSPVRTNINNMAVAANSLGASDTGVYIATNTIAPLVTSVGDFSARTGFDTTQHYVSGVAASENLFKYAITPTLGNVLVGSAGVDAGNVLTVAAVPEPGTYALMFAGLFAMGAVVRRRNSR